MNGEAKPIGAAALQSRILDYAELAKPELTFLSVLSALCGYMLGANGNFNVWLFAHTAAGTLLLGGGAGAINQFTERRYDALMKRTERRPLPSGRLLPAEALVFGTAMSVLGVAELMIFTNFLTAVLGVVTFTMYLFLYTPLKRVTHLSTLVGAVPGAIPPLMGWAAARGQLTAEAWTLFAILFCWQIPHFLSLAWMYRKDYARAGYKMLSVTDTEGVHTARQVVFYTIALLPLTLQLTVTGKTGIVYAVAAVAGGLVFLWYASRLVKFAGSVSTDNARAYHLGARRLFIASLIYLPLLMIFMSLDRL